MADYSPDGAGRAPALSARADPFEGLGWTPKAVRRQKYLLLLEDVSVSFDGFKALDGLDLRLAEGEIRCLIGPNGAGKSTLLDVITGQTRPDFGEAWFDETFNLLEEDEVSIAQRGIGRKFQRPSVFESLSVWSNLELALQGPKTVWRSWRARLTGAERSFLEEILALVSLSDKAGELAGALSHGQKQWLEIGTLLAQKPRVLLLDEPVAGMTPQEIERSAELILSLEGRATILVVEHDMKFVRSIARTVTVLCRGQALAEGTMDQVSQNPRVREAYLGEAAC
ncbi:MAG: urea ABC transporter ATP-binding protein UrtD [Deltaproteobacteria bacterium]|jgi:urea transport system ATP-binding protein|nr:urea ABC transporter ATP-binding protein UrtD [Deltaproteobacteria bacterium]